MLEDSQLVDISLAVSELLFHGAQLPSWSQPDRSRNIFQGRKTPFQFGRKCVFLRDLVKMVPSRSMGGDRNLTSVTMFVLLGISEDKEMQLSLFPVFLLIYLVTLFWNLGLITLIRMDSHLHTPMYFFLSALSFIDICYTSSISPRMLADLFKDEKMISFVACATQCFVASWMGQTECCLLAAMAYDRYVAIGKPLQYSTIMAPGLCWKLVAGVLGCGFISTLIEVVTCFEMYYCGPNVIQNFFCNLTEISSLSCSNPFISQMSLFLIMTFVVLGSLVIILLSYAFIVASILKISSVKGSTKAFNTCASHLVVVTLFFGTALAVYLHPSSGHSTKQNRFLSVFYVIIIPMLNPFIYSLRNKEIKDALKRVLKRTTHLSH
ncbi:olfactory receptor 5A1-like isoform X2 [Talpa occidentalis]|uniref:olfactory receptor 5A1-like isoform X2 n=1 Tax=Talpa occidentalis TaxID=50954 RepID=UPI00188F0BE6|nr:olfactory receptor 5A1-like isoform X2 [Talpa occidentalis]